MEPYKLYEKWKYLKKELSENADTKIEDSHPYTA